jgi:hypothetical protein
MRLGQCQTVGATPRGCPVGSARVVAFVDGQTQGSAPTGDGATQWQIVGATPCGCPIGWRLRGAFVNGRTRGSAPTGNGSTQWQTVGATPCGCPIGGACVDGIRGWADTGVRPYG